MEKTPGWISWFDFLVGKSLNSKYQPNYWNRRPEGGLRVETLLWPSDHQSVTTGLASQISTTVSKKTKQKVEPPTNNLPSKYLQNLHISKVQPAQIWQANEDFFFVFSITYPFLSARKKIIYIYIYIYRHIYTDIISFIERKRKK